MSDNSKLTLLETREPFKQTNAELSSAKNTLALIHDMAQKVATEHKMKSRQETTSLGQIATVTEKRQ